jgi:hypothetical protein
MKVSNFSSQSPAKASFGAKKALLVELEPAKSNAVSMILAGVSHANNDSVHITKATSQEALQALHAGDKFDVVVTNGHPSSGYVIDKTLKTHPSDQLVLLSKDNSLAPFAKAKGIGFVDLKQSDNFFRNVAGVVSKALFGK